MPGSEGSPGKKRSLLTKNEGSPEKKKLKHFLGTREPLQMHGIDPHFSALKKNFDKALLEKTEMAKKIAELHKYIQHLKSTQTEKS